MSCLHRYWVKEFTKLFVIIQMVILVLFVFIDYLSRLDRFLESGISLWLALWYVVLKLPFMFIQLTPAGILLAVIVVFGTMNRNNELVALRSSGISVYYLAKPVMAAGVVLALVMFLVGEFLIPVSMSRANYLRYYKMVKNADTSQVRNDVWVKQGQTLIHINYFDPAALKLSGFTATTMGDDFKIQMRVDAQRGYYGDGRWVFEDGSVQSYSPGNSDYEVAYFDSRAFDFDLNPDTIGNVSRKTNEMSFGQLRAYAKKVAAEGYDATVYRVDMHGKIAFPFICIFMGLIGAATGMGRRVRNNMPVGIALGVVISFFYWVSYGLCLSMGYAKVLPPVVAAWVTNVFFLMGGAVYLMRVE